jgi:uncharacterized protein involved in exopolysaccharide biosynthesis
MNGDRTFEISRVWNTIVRRRVGLTIFVLSITLAAAAVAFLLPPWYRADAELLPPGEEDSGFGLSSLLRGVGVPGIKIPTLSTPADVFVSVLQSRMVNDEVVRRFDLKNRYRQKLTEDAVKELRSHAHFKMNQSGTISISVEDRDPQRAVQMVNAYIELLDHFNREVRMSKGRRTRLFVEQRLAEAQKDLADAEQRLAEYQATHKTVALSPEASSAVETAAKLFAQRAALEMRLGLLRSYTRSGSDEEQQMTDQMAQVDRQLQALPGTGLQLARLMRETKTQEQLYLLLVAQREDARITEARDVATVEVLDPATLPERKSRPKRSIIIAAAFLIATATGTVWAAVRDDGAPVREAS